LGNWIFDDDDDDDDDEVDSISWESTGENVKASSSDSQGYYELKQHKL
jgi:hypothetical protein